MARRYRYAVIKEKGSGKGRDSVKAGAASIILFLLAVIFGCAVNGRFEEIYGGICLFASMLSVYGLILGLLSFCEKNQKHFTGIIGSILNGLIVISLIGLLLISR